MTYVVLDFETASASDLKKEGAWKYSESPTTEILCLGYSIDGMPPMLLTPEDLVYVGNSLPLKPGQSKTLLEVMAENPSCIFIAHNAMFEKAIWRNIMVKQYGWPNIPNSRWHDSMAVAAMKALPMKLERAALAMRLSEQTGQGHQRIVTAPSKPKKDGSYDRSPETLDKVYSENRQDVLCEVELNNRIGGLQPCERAVWLLDQRINERGALVDLDFVAACQKIIDGATVPLVQEFRDITGGISPTQRDAVMAWASSNGLNLPNLQKATIDALLGGGEDDDDEVFAETHLFEMPASVRRALEIRRKVGSASIKKLSAIRSSACADGRVRGIVQYHGAGPGRWVGRLFQPHNFPRGSLKFDAGTAAESVPDVELVYQALSSGDWRYVESLFGDCFEVVISGLRHAIISGPGRVLNVGDFNTIEARVVLAIAGAEKALAILTDKNRDVYCEMASSIFDIQAPYGKDQVKVFKTVHLAERQTGKNTVLGCFGPETLVLTNHGFIPIIQVRSCHKLWDGTEWVEHQGLVNQGRKKVCLAQGIWATPEHPVWCGERWAPWEQVVLNDYGLSQALAVASENLPFEDIVMANEAELLKLSSLAHAAQPPTEYLLVIYTKALLRDAIFALKNKRTTGGNGSSDTPISSQRKNIGSDCSIASPLVLGGVNERRPKLIITTEHAASMSGRDGLRIGKSFFAIWSRLTAGINRSWRLIASTWIKDTSRAISALQLGARTWPINDKSEPCKNGSWSWKNVYDIANVGPRNRFMVLSDEGPLLVHNCGFQMGWKKFRARYCPDQSEEFAKKAVDAYREDFAPEVPVLWAGLEEAALRAVWDHRPTEAYGLEFRHEDIWLTMRLHSGRKLYYAYPQACKKATPWDETDIRPAWTCKAQKNGRWISRDMYGGLITENAVQAEARDLLVNGMFLAEKNNLPIVLTVHDEIIAEPLTEHSNHEMLGQLMSDRPQWAIDLRIPVAAETWAGNRYKK